MKQYWKIKELTAIGYRDELRRADEADYGFDHSPIDDSLYTYRFSELLQSPYFRWLVLFNAKNQFDFSDDELAEFKQLYQPYQIEDRYLASELSQCFNFTRWYSEHQFLSPEDHDLLQQLAKLADAVKLFSVSDQEKMFRELLELVSSDDTLFFDHLATLLRTDQSDDLADNLNLNVGNHDLEKTGISLQIYVVQHLDRLLKQLIQRSKNDENIEFQYSSPDLVSRLQKLSNHLETLAHQADAQPMLSVTNVDYTFLKFAANLFREYGDISERYDQLVENGDLINWQQLSEQYLAASQNNGDWISYAAFHEYTGENAADYMNESLIERKLPHADDQVDPIGLLIENDNS